MFILNKYKPYFILSNIKVIKTVFVSLFLLFVSNYAYNFIQIVYFEHNTIVSLYINDFESENNDHEPEEENESEETDKLDEFIINSISNYNSYNLNYFNQLNLNQIQSSVFIDITIPPPKV